MPSRSTRIFSPLQRWRRRLAQASLTTLIGILAGIALAGCAAQAAYRDGKALVTRGKVEEGLAKFQEAMQQEPRDAEYKAAYLQTRERAVATYVEQGDRLLAAGKWAEAEKFYQRALAIDPAGERARTGLHALDADQRHAKLFTEAALAWEKKDADGAQLTLRSILAENPGHANALALKRSILEKTRKAPAESALDAAYKKHITIEFKDVALKQLFEVVSRTSGLNFLFDKEVNTDQKTSIFLKDSTIASAVHYALMTNQLEQQVLDGNTILIYPNTAAKLKDYQELVVKSFFLANADAKAVAASLKTIVKSRDVVVDEKLNMVIVRDSPDAIRLAEKLVALHDVPEPEVMLEVEILEVKRTRLLELGIEWPDTLSLSPLPAMVASALTAPSSTTGSSTTTGGTLTLRDLRFNLNSGTIAASLSPVTVHARKQDSDANILANPRIRARNHEKAKILIGERVPNITTTATATGFVSESINYVDVGLKLDVEPSVYLDNDVAIKISLEVSNIVSQLQTKSGSIAYQIGTRTASTVLRLRDGENQVLAGLINDEDRRGANKLPFIGEIPVIGRLFGSSSDDNQKTEIVLSITPRIIRNIQRPEAAMAEFKAGTDSSLRSRPETISSAAFGTPPAASQAPTSVTPAASPQQSPTPPPASAIRFKGARSAANTPAANSAGAGEPADGVAAPGSMETRVGNP
ncbi:secretin N-terminal domain-containing protein [Undibacterium arcticum]|uniref:Secretin N-terminal domain-containing protein n=1 Tax=Undibacterium arcticum TaxID=1762892 RepID=A0ABV7F593_9BURK